MTQKFNLWLNYEREAETGKGPLAMVCASGQGLLFSLTARPPMHRVSAPSHHHTPTALATPASRRIFLLHWFHHALLLPKLCWLLEGEGQSLWQSKPFYSAALTLYLHIFSWAAEHKPCSSLNSFVHCFYFHSHCHVFFESPIQIPSTLKYSLSR